MQYIDDETMKILKKYHTGSNLELVSRQMECIMKLIEYNKMKYMYSHDYREAIDDILKEIISGSFLS